MKNFFKGLLFAGSLFGLTAERADGFPQLWVVVPCGIVLFMFVYANFIRADEEREYIIK